MNKKISRILRTNIALFSLCLVAFVVAAVPVSPVLALAEAVVVVLVFLLSRRNSASAQQSVRQYMQRYNGGMDSARSANMLYAPMGMVVFDFDTKAILWANDNFLELAGKDEGVFETPIDEVVPEFPGHWLVEGKKECPELVVWEHRQFRVYGSISRADEIAGVNGSLATTYWVDVTETEQMRTTIEDTRPVAAILMVDNYEDLMKACPESKRSAVLAAVEEKIGAWTADAEGMLLKYDRDRYLFIFEERHFPGYAERRFDLLDQVREVVAGEGVAATMSIGVGREADNYDALLKNASLALEMALSRGGDQAVVKDRNNFDFFGGRSKTTEKRTKVKSRVMANALGELMDEAERVYVMGHKYADMDCLGAAAGICAIARKRGKKAQIVMDLENNAVHPMVKKLMQLPEYAGMFLSGTEAFLRVQPGTLLVVVDTNRPGSVESEQLLDACNRVAVIDH
ncbi:MAG: DHH family phosphoesterase, partial [Clostridia bacterium]|nr:DHH family phosphoesterase [Clostridia bacterium]